VLQALYHPTAHMSIIPNVNRSGLHYACIQHVEEEKYCYCISTTNWPIDSYPLYSHAVMHGSCIFVVVQSLLFIVYPVSLSLYS